MLRGETPFALREDVVNAEGATRRRAPARRCPATPTPRCSRRSRRLRGAIATAQKQPAYVIFPDRTLIEMAKARPRHARRSCRRSTASARSKLQKYGSAFLAVIRDHVACLNCPRSRPCAAASRRRWSARGSPKVEARRGDIRFPFPPRFAERLKGERVLSPDPPGQISALALDSGETLITHLGMSGSFRIDARRPSPWRLPPSALEGRRRTTTSSSTSITATSSPTTTRAASASWIWSTASARRTIRGFADSATSRCGRNSTRPNSPSCSPARARR